MIITDKAIKKIFDGYIAEKQDREYHSEGCLKAEKELESVLDNHIKGSGAWMEAFTSAVILANEYEQDGFIAGFKEAMQMFGIGEVENVA